MGDQFSKVYTGRPNLYVEGSPIVIMASALTKDNYRNTLFAQFKFKNLEGREIKAILLSFDVMDIKGKLIQTVEEYQYLDLNLKRSKHACGDIPIQLENTIGRSVLIKAIEIVFEDGDNWVSESADWKPIPAQQLLSDSFGAEELGTLKEIYGWNVEYFARSYMDLNLCMCGEIHKKDISECPVCKNHPNDDINKSKSDFEDEIHYYLGKIFQNKSGISSREEAIAHFQKCQNYKDSAQRIQSCNKTISNLKKAAEEEARQRQLEEELRIEQSKLRKKKIKKAACIGGPIIAALTAFLIVLFAYILPQANYKKATEALALKNYSSACALLEKHPSFKESEKLILQAKECMAQELLDKKEYDQAYEIFREIDEWPAAEENMKARAQQYLENDEYDKAYVLFEALEDTAAIVQNKYSRAEEMIKQGKYDAAEALLKEIKTNDKAQDLLQTIPALRLESTLKNAKKGDIIRFGTFEQDNVSSNGAEAIEWIVLEKTEKSMLIISKYALTFKMLHNSYSTECWEYCRLRAWLESEFYQDSFTSTEKKLIINAKVTKDANPDNNLNYGRDTVDHVFLLSKSQVEKYMSQPNRVCYPTKYAVTQTKWYDSAENPVYWWIRAPSGYTVDQYGTYSIGGLYLNSSDGSLSGYQPDAVRPAMWISFSGTADDGSKYFYIGTESSDLNVRAEKSTSSKVIERIPKDTLVRVDEYGTDWSKITYKGKTGYVSSEYLKKAS